MGARGGRGGNGHNAEIGSEVDCVGLLKAPPVIYASMFNIAFERPDHPGHCRRRYFCKRNPGNGARGGRGQPGTPGTPGKRGGDSSEVSVNIAEPSDIRITFEKSPGKGGAGGSGGMGGPGGVGGSPGKRTKRKLCKNGQMGPLGPRGPRGAVGAGGPNGNPRPICISIGGSSVGDC